MTALPRSCKCVNTDPLRCGQAKNVLATMCDCDCHKANCCKCGHPVYWHNLGQCGCCDPANNYCDAGFK